MNELAAYIAPPLQRPVGIRLKPAVLAKVENPIGNHEGPSTGPHYGLGHLHEGVGTREGIQPNDGLALLLREPLHLRQGLAASPSPGLAPMEIGIAESGVGRCFETNALA